MIDETQFFYTLRAKGGDPAGWFQRISPEGVLEFTTDLRKAKQFSTAEECRAAILPGLVLEGINRRGQWAHKRRVP